MTHAHWMALAIDQANLAAEQGEVPVGAVLVNNATQELIGSAHNECEQRNDPTAHAELLLLQSASSKIDLLHSDLTLYVTLEPCPMCAGAIVQSRVRRVVYGADDPKAGAAGSVVNLLTHPRLDFRAEVIAGIREEDCSQLLKQFFQRRR